MTKKSESDRADIYTRITDRIVEDLEQGVRPWMKPWSAANTHSRISRPMRHNGLPYSGMNVLLLWSEQVSRGFSSSTRLVRDGGAGPHGVRWTRKGGFPVRRPAGARRPAS